MNGPLRNEIVAPTFFGSVPMIGTEGIRDGFVIVDLLIIVVHEDSPIAPCTEVGDRRIFHFYYLSTICLA